MTVSKWTRRIAVAVGASLLTSGIAAWPAAAATPEPGVTRVARLLPGTVPPGATKLGAVAGAQQVPVEVVLTAGNPAAVVSLLARLYTPGSALYHHWLKPGDFQLRFGPSAATVAATKAWLTSAGATAVHATGFAVRAELPAAKVSSALGAPLERYRLASGRAGFRAQAAPLVPASLAGRVAGILGLDTLDQAVPAGLTSPPATRARTSDGLAPVCGGAQNYVDNGYLSFPQVGIDYKIDSLLSQGQDGHGQVIGLYELAPHSAADVSAYESCFGLTSPVATVKVDGGGTVNANGTLEADVDVEQVASQAPGASVISYEGPNGGTGTYDVWAEIVGRDAAQVIASSWGSCEVDAARAGEITAFSTLFEQAAAQGQTILVASGDNGAEGCFATDGLTTPQVTYPASDAWVTAVGGTTLDPFGTEEVTWNNCQDNESAGCAKTRGGASAGGLSRYVPRPSFQPGVLKWATAQACGTTTCRQVPDISANAGYAMVDYSAGGWGGIGGTSLSAPFMAGLVADKNDGCTTSTGLWTESLYPLAAQGVYGTALTDITAGDNDETGSNGGQYAARTGFDGATGLGSPLADGLSCPEVTAVQPATGPAGATVTLTGLGLEKAAVYFGTVAAKVVKETATSATVVVPAGSGNTAVSAASVNGTGVSARAYTYVPALTATAGGGQSAVAGQGFPAKLEATVQNPDGTPDAGVAVTFTVNKAGGASFPGGKVTATVLTSAAGVATAPALTAGPSAGTFTVMATAPGVAGTGNYTLTAEPNQADLSTGLTGPKSAAEGARFTVTVSVRNSGPAAGNSVTTRMAVPAGLTIVSADGAARSGSELTWKLASLANGKTRAYSVVLKAAAKGKTVTIAASAAETTRDPDTADAKATLAVKLS